MNVQFDVQNLTNELFLYNFESIFSGTHVGYPRLLSGRLNFQVQIGREPPERTVAYSMVKNSGKSASQKLGLCRATILV